ASQSLLKSFSYEKPHLAQVIARGYSAETETDEDFDCRFEPTSASPTSTAGSGVKVLTT
ncbi:hypothetical protein LSTR_LSTR016759, partial [Laodelphax striatellus]